MNPRAQRPAGWRVARAASSLRTLARSDHGPAGAGRRVLACALICDPAGSPRTVVDSPVAVAQRVDEHTLLVSVLHDDAASATRQLEGLCRRARGQGC